MNRKKQTKAEREAAQSRRRAEVILKVRSGIITATEGAAMLGVSRRIYYKWENRALDAMAKALEDKPVGRPGPTVENMQMIGLEDEVHRLKQEIQEMQVHQKLKDQTWRLKVDITAQNVKKKTE